MNDYDCGHPADRHYQDDAGEWWCMGDPDERCRCRGCIETRIGLLDDPAIQLPNGKWYAPIERDGWREWLEIPPPTP